MIKGLFPLRVLLIFVLISGCSSNTAPSSYFESKSNYRGVANVESILDKDELQLNSCFETVKNDCYRRHPFIEAAANLSDDDKDLYFKAKWNFQNCVLNEAVVCAYQSYNQEYVERLNRFKREFLIGEDHRHLAWTKFRDINLQGLMDFTFDINRLGKSFQETPQGVLGVSISNTDLVTIPTPFSGIAVKDNKEMKLFCRAPLPDKAEAALQEKGSYRSSGCGEKIKLGGQKIILNMDYGYDVIVGFSFGAFARALVKYGEASEIALSEVKSQLLSLAEQNAQFVPSLEIAVANQILDASEKIHQASLRILQSGNLSKDSGTNLPKELAAFIKALQSAMDECVLYSMPAPLHPQVLSDRKLYIVKFGEFGTIKAEAEDQLKGMKAIEFLNPFLLSADKLEMLSLLELQSQQYQARIQQDCSSKQVILLDQKFIESEID